MHPDRMSPPSAVPPILCLSLLAGLAGGCDSGDTIQTYVVPKEKQPAVAQMAAAATPTGPAMIHWELPPGWRTAPNPNAMRFATLLAGDADKQVEVSVTQLAGNAGGIEANVNRWRGQLGLPQATPKEIVDGMEIVNAHGVQGAFVDLYGEPKTDKGPVPRMLATIFTTGTDTWFIKTMGNSAIIEPQREPFLELCRSVSFSGGEPAAAPGPMAAAVSPPAPVGDDMPQWPQVPENWTRDAQPRPMAVVSFTVQGGGQEAEMTVTRLGGGQDLLANVNRWRRQVGLGPLSDMSEQPPKQIEIAGQPADLVDVAGETKRTIGAISSRGAATWYYKLSGPDPLVSSQRDAFEQFVRSTRFEGESGG